MKSLGERVAEYRDAFDRAFAEPATHEAGRRTLLALRAADRPVAIDAAEVARVERVGRVARIAGPPARIGLAAVRGRLLAVWDLAVLLGAGRLANAAPWLVVAEPGIALACDGFEGVLRVPEGEIRPLEEGAHVVGVIRDASGTRGLVSVASIRSAVSDRAGLGGTA